MAKHYLEMPWKLLRQSRVSGQTEDVEVLKSEKIGSMMVNWLWSTGLNRSSTVLADTILLKRLMPLLVIEGQTRPVWAWLDHLRSKEDHLRLYSNLPSLGDYPVGPAIRSQEALLSLVGEMSDQTDHVWAESLRPFKAALERSDPMVQFRVLRQARFQHKYLLLCLTINTNHFGGGLDNAMKVFLTSFATYPTDTERNRRRFIHSSAGGYIIKAVLQSIETTRLDLATYDAFQESMQHWSTRKSLHHAILALGHPTGSSAHPAYSLFQWYDIGGVVDAGRATRRTCLKLGLVAADYLLSSGRKSDAVKGKNVMSVLERHFAEELGALKMTVKTTSDRINSDDNLALFENGSEHVHVAS